MTRKFFGRIVLDLTKMSVGKMVRPDYPGI
jgi:hypothetical protein